MLQKPWLIARHCKVNTKDMIAATTDHMCSIRGRLLKTIAMKYNKFYKEVEIADRSTVLANQSIRGNQVVKP